MKTEEIISHWQYLKEVLEREIPDDMSYSKAEHIELMGFHYMTAMTHGAKHGIDHERRRN